MAECLIPAMVSIWEKWNKTSLYYPFCYLNLGKKFRLTPDNGIRKIVGNGIL